MEIKDQSGLSRTFTEYLEDKKDINSRVPKSIFKQYKLAVPVVLWKSSIRNVSF